MKNICLIVPILILAVTAGSPARLNAQRNVPRARTAVFKAGHFKDQTAVSNSCQALWSSAAASMKEMLRPSPLAKHSPGMRGQHDGTDR